VVFSNNKCIPVEKFENQIRTSLIDGQYFVAETAGVPNLWAWAYDAELDHGWHEFEGLEASDACSDNVDSRDITTFFNDVREKR
jgi:hypothetical protein